MQTAMPKCEHYMPIWHRQGQVYRYKINYCLLNNKIHHLSN